VKISQKNRKIGYTYSSVSGLYAFRKTKSIAYESTLERDLLVSLEYDSTVDDVVEQPFTIEYVNHNGRAASYTPDFLVHYLPEKGKKNKRISELIEVKPSNILNGEWNDLKKKFKVGVAFAKENGYVFKIYNETRIHTQEFSNIKFLERYSRFQINQDVLKSGINKEMFVRRTSIGSLVSHLNRINGAESNSLALVWHLVYIKFLRCDFSNKLDLDTKVWLNDDQDRSPFYG